eukprot:TRINITY_DN15835_c0_g1_i1.p1 TRINITY_DN15835_c0_g1~~TRINITY_DN15835_c0_g1_i1.p1  ORF type:complete len:173 (+),score=40.99 TRINITY_DN15835_c0_g1_i1:114-632(+)
MSKMWGCSAKFVDNDTSLLDVSHDDWNAYYTNCRPEKGFTIQIKVHKLEKLNNTCGLQLGCFYSLDNRYSINKSIGAGYVALTGALADCLPHYGVKWGTGDLVRMIVYSDRSVEFFVNGESQGICFTLEKLPVIPAVCVSSTAHVEIINYFEIDDDDCPDMETTVDKRLNII